MSTKLDRTIKRELEVDGQPYTITISTAGVKITPKGHRRGAEITWRALLSGDAELAQQLRVSVEATRKD